jgi:K+-sensing histidine kinase KdpD
MTPSFQHHRSTSSGGSLSSRSSEGLLSSILADCTRARREQGQPQLAAMLDVSQQHEQSLLADPSLVRRALEPLVRRALESAAQSDASREPPLVREVIVTSIDLGDAIEIEVADSGQALSDGVRKWLGENPHHPNDTGVVPEGAGLALVAVRAAVTRIDGTLRAVNCPEGGVAITLRLPRRQARRLAA